MLVAPSNTGNSQQFGKSVALCGNRALIGTPVDFIGSLQWFGAAYVFELSGTAWTQTGKLVAADGANADLFGWSVALDGDRAVVGAHQDDDLGLFSGSAYVFDLAGGSWSQTAKLTPTGGLAGDRFGHSVALRGGRVLVGAFGHDALGGNSGAAYVFEEQPGAWSETAELLAVDGGRPTASATPSR